MCFATASLCDLVAFINNSLSGDDVNTALLTESTHELRCWMSRLITVAVPLLLLLCVLLQRADAVRTDKPAHIEDEYDIRAIRPSDRADPIYPVNITDTVPAWMQCPNGTLFVRKRSIMRVRSQVVGCCPANFTAYSMMSKDVVLACCPQDQVPCFNRFTSDGPYPTWIGCADSPAQCCTSHICPTGYGCCRTMNAMTGRCRPHKRDNDTFTPLDIFAYGHEVNSSDYKEFTRAGTSAIGETPTRPRRYRYPRCTPLINVDLFPQNQTVYEVEPGFQLQRCESNTSIPYRRQSFDLFHADDVCEYINTWNGPGGVRTIGACPVNHTMCRKNPTDGMRTYGCANDLRGETCCAPHICPASFKCCAFHPKINGTEATNVTFARHCCPEASECCFGNPDAAIIDGDPTLTQQRLRPYCGMTIDGVPCARDVMESVTVYQDNRQLANMLIDLGV